MSALNSLLCRRFNRWSKKSFAVALPNIVLPSCSTIQFNSEGESPWIPTEVTSSFLPNTGKKFTCKRRDTVDGITSPLYLPTFAHFYPFYNISKSRQRLNREAMAETKDVAADIAPENKFRYSTRRKPQWHTPLIPLASVTLYHREWRT